MSGSVYSRGRRRGWAYQIFLGKDAAGKQRRITKSGFATRREAETALRAALNELEARRIPREGETITLGRALQLYIEASRLRLAGKTMQRYEDMVSYFDAELLSKPLGELTPLDLEREYWRLRERGGRSRKDKSPRPLSPKTVRALAGLISAALNDCVRLGFAKESPARAVKLPPLSKRREPRALSPQELEAWFAAARGHWIEPLLRFLAGTGCRRGEALALTWDDVDTQARVITISKSLEQTRAGLRVKGTKTGAVRRISVGPFVLDALADQAAQQREWREFLGTDGSSSRLVFAAPDGGFLRPDTVTAEACRIAHRAGLKGAGLHVLRHTHASQLLSAGVPLPAVSKRLGHANPNITAAVYSHALPGDDDRAAATWERVVEPLRSGSSKQVQ